MKMLHRSPPSIVIFIVLALSSLTAVQSRKSLCIGAFFGVNVSDGGWSSQALIYALEMALNHINNDTTILKDYRLWYQWRDSMCESGASIRALLDLMDNNPPHKIAFLGPGCSLAARPVADSTRYFKSVQVGYSITSPIFTNTIKFPYLFRTAPSETMENPARIALLKHFKWTKVALITQLMDIYTMTKENLLGLLASENITLITSEGFREDPLHLVKLMKEKDARIIIALMYEDKFRKTICHAFRQGFFGKKIVWITVGWYSPDWWKVTDDVTCAPDQLKMASSNLIETAPLDITSSTEPLHNLEQNAKDLIQEFNKIRLSKNLTENLYATFTYDAAWTIALMLNKSIPLLAKHNKTLESLTYKDQTAVDIFVKILHQTDFNGMSGRVTFDKYGDRQTFIKIVQNKLGGNRSNVGFYDARSAKINFSEPGFVWPEGRAPVSGSTIKDMNYAEETVVTITFITLSTLGIIFCLFCLGLNYCYRKHRYIKMSSPHFNNITVLGCCLCYTDVLLSTITASDLTTWHRLVCVLRPWFLSTGFTLAFGGMFAKTYRVYKIFTNTELKKELGPLSNRTLFIRLAVYWVGSVAALLAWQVSCPITSSLELIKQVQANDNEDWIYAIKFHRCVSDHYTQWVVGLICYQGLLLLFGMFLAWETRNVEHQALNDSKSIALAVYNVFMFSAVTVLTEFALNDIPTKLLLSRISIYACSTSTICLLFVPKIYHIKNGNRVMALSSCQGISQHRAYHNENNGWTVHTASPATKES